MITPAQSKMAAPAFNTNTDSLPVNPDLQKERDSASFKVKELTHILDGGPQATKRRKELEKLILSDPTFASKNMLYLDKSGLYENAVLRSVKLAEWQKKYNWTEEDMMMATQQININQEAMTLHRDMFIPALQRLTSEEQREKWLPLALNFKIIGTYAQTELGHGTNLRSLETTATFDRSTDEFVLNTPKITSMKWWPGGLGKTSTHAIVLAQLMINGKNHGLQPFIVQLRSLTDHQPMPGVMLGDIGPKMTVNYVDNGFLILKNVRIPREQMLMGNNEVTRDGQFKTLKSDKSNYSTMMYVRVMFTKWAYGTLSRSLTIAVRYSAVRRQLYIDPNAPEVQILDYQTQQYKLFPAMASTFALFFTAKNTLNRYNTELPRLLAGDSDVLAEFHSLTSGLKAICSDISTEHCEVLRRSLGGHGFMMCAGLPSIMMASLTLVTAEGENTVLYQQVARHLVKQVALAMSGTQISGATSYLGQNMDSIGQLESKADCRNLHLLLQIYQKMSFKTVMQTAVLLQSDISAGLTQHATWNKNQVNLVRAAKAHSLTHVVRCNVEAVEDLKRTASPELVTVLQRLCCLFALYYLDVNSGMFMQTGAISPEQIDTVKAVEMDLLAEIRPDAVTLVDAADVPDECHQSLLGCYDGNVYPRMYASALGEPMNKTQVHPSYQKYIKDMISGSKSKL